MTDNWTGLPEHTCGEHYSVGGRAWCHDCSEWCYPDMPCFRCCIPLIRDVMVAAHDVVQVEDHTRIAALERLRAAVEAADDAGAEL